MNSNLFLLDLSDKVFRLVNFRN